MARHFGAQHIQNGYAGMGGNLKRPIHKRGSTRSVAESISAARKAAARAARIKSGKKRK